MGLPRALSPMRAPGTQPVRVALLGDSAELRARLMSAAAPGDIELLEGDGQTTKPDVVLADVDDAAGEPADVVAEYGDCAVLVLTDHLSEHEAAALLAGGAAGLLSRDAGAAQLMAAIRSAAAGLVVVVPELFPAPVRHRAAPSLIPAPPLVAAPSPPGPGTPVGARERLTPRETEVLNLLAAGLSNKEIAQRLRISDHTVKYHLASVFGKLGAASRTEAVMRGIQQGIVLI